MRGGLTAATTVSSLFASGSPKELVVASGQTLFVDGDDVNGGALKVSGAGNLTVDARDDVAGEVTAVVSLQFVEARLQQLRGEMTVSQTAHVAYARSLKVALAQTPGPVASTTPSP